MKLCGVEFAPLNIPLERRLQTLIVAIWIFLGAFGNPISWCITVVIFLFGYQWMKLLMIIYFIFMYYDKDTRFKGGRSMASCFKFRDAIWWRYYCNYFPIKLVKTVDIDPTKNYLFCSFPHGVLASGISASFLTTALESEKVFPGLEFRLLTLDQHFLAPFFREYVLSHGACSCDVKSLNYLLSTKPTVENSSSKYPVSGRAAIIIVGGAAEAFESKPNTYKIVLKRRKGFIRVALKNGSPLVPIFSFGETDIYDQVDTPRVRKVQEFIKTITGVAPLLLLGRGLLQYSFGILPHRGQIHVVVGGPLDVPKIENPTKEQIEDYHARFTEKLIELFETHKSKYVKDHEKVSLILTDR